MVILVTVAWLIRTFLLQLEKVRIYGVTMIAFHYLNRIKLGLVYGSFFTIREQTERFEKYISRKLIKI